MGHTLFSKTLANTIDRASAHTLSSFAQHNTHSAHTRTHYYGLPRQNTCFYFSHIDTHISLSLGLPGAALVSPASVRRTYNMVTFDGARINYSKRAWQCFAASRRGAVSAVRVELKLHCSRQWSLAGSVRARRHGHGQIGRHVTTTQSHEMHNTTCRTCSGCWSVGVFLCVFGFAVHAKSSPGYLQLNLSDH